MKLTASMLRKSLVVLGAICLVAACNSGDTARSHGADNKNVLTFTAANFPAEVLSSSHPVLVDFWAAWCGPCKVIAPIISELATEFDGKIKVGKVDVDAEPELARQYNISAIPTLLIFKDGKVVEQIVGLSGKQELQATLAKYAGESAPKSTSPNQ